MFSSINLKIKFMIRVVFIQLILLFAYTKSFGQEVKVLSWNIRFDTKNDAVDQWNNRKKDMIIALKKESPDFFGIQEGLIHQVQYLDKKLKKYKYIGVGRDDGKVGGEMMALFYDHNKWKPIDTGNFWLSDTPDQVSRGWDAACNRITTYGVFRNSIGDTIAVYNTHLDHMGVEARKNSVRQLNQIIVGNPYPKILIGDFNFNPNNPLYTELTTVWSDSKLATPNIFEDQDGTFNGFKIDIVPKDRIDYILTDERWHVNYYRSANLFTKKGRHISDHNMVLAAVSLLRSSSYLYRRHLTNGDTLPFRILYPSNFNPNIKYPLVLFLHGAGERGNDNLAQLTHGSQLFLDSIERYPAIVIFPQCKSDQYWASVDVTRASGKNEFIFKDSQRPTEELQKVIALLQKMQQTSYVDNARLYVGGLSMGGMGTWELLWRLPNTFASAIPICGGGLVSNASKIGSTKIWAFHGDQDQVVDVKYTQDMINALKDLGKMPKFTIYEGVNHNSWTPAFAERQLLNWLFSNKQ